LINNFGLYVTSGFGRGMDEIFLLLGRHAAEIGIYRKFGTGYRTRLQGSSSPRSNFNK